MALVIVIVVNYCWTFPCFCFSYVCFTVVYDGYKTDCGKVFFFFKFVFQGSLDFVCPFLYFCFLYFCMCVFFFIPAVFRAHNFGGHFFTSKVWLYPKASLLLSWSIFFRDSSSHLIVLPSTTPSCWKENQIILIEGSHTLTSSTDTNPSRLGGTGVLQCQIVSR